MAGNYTNWADNVPGAWYYYDMIEAGNNHSFTRSERMVENQAYFYENWLGVLAGIDWDTLENGVKDYVDRAPELIDEHINYLVGYADGTVRPNAPITRAEVATIFYRLMREEVRAKLQTDECAYTDVDAGDWYCSAVATLTRGGFLKGYPDGSFRPNEPISRAELAVVLCRFDSAFGWIECDGGFSDTEGHWAKAHIDFSATRGYVVGYPEGIFAPNRDISRAETVAMVNRLLQRFVDEEGLSEDAARWSDCSPESWYYCDIVEATNNHDFERSEREAMDGAFHENWTGVKPAIDWNSVK